MIPNGYSERDLERFVPEERGSSASRGEFARDRARVLHSSALRRLGAKTQVLSPTGGDFARTRLTHSLEVAQVGREMATDLGLDPDVVDTACLAHDLGHPPFGHNGEKALNSWAEDFGGFEGNAQTLRLLSRIEPKVFDELGISRGLNLTRASLDAACKYPWSRDHGLTDTGADNSLKFGFYADDSEIFAFLRADSVPGLKCIEAEVMDFADDVAYSVHDFEDAVVAGFIPPAELTPEEPQETLVEKILKWSGGTITVAEIISALERLGSNPYWLRTFSGSMKEQATLKNLTSSLIGSFVARTTSMTKESNAAQTMVRYRGKLAIPKDVQAEISVLKGIVSVFLMNQERRQPFYEWQRAILIELADALLAANGKQLDNYCALAWEASRDESAKHRVIVDQVASLTDVSALNLHNQLVGKRN